MADLAHPSEHPNPHPHDRHHGRDRHHEHPHPVGGRPGRLHRLAHLLRPHSHGAADRIDGTTETSAEGLRTLWVSLLVLGLTAGLQAGMVALSGSAALLGDTVHNAADALTAVPLGPAFLLGRRAANRTFTYGYGRAEDLAGVAVMAVMPVVAVSAVLAAAAAVDRLLHPRPVGHLRAVAPAILLVLNGSVREIGRRLMGGVDPSLVDAAEEVLRRPVPRLLAAAAVRSPTAWPSAT